MDTAIPEEQLARIRPIVDQVIRDLRALSAKLPDDAESALIYSPSESAE
jgi:hypothetical protein